MGGYKRKLYENISLPIEPPSSYGIKQGKLFNGIYPAFSNVNVLAFLVKNDVLAVLHATQFFLHLLGYGNLQLAADFRMAYLCHVFYE